MILHYDQYQYKVCLKITRKHDYLIVQYLIQLLHNHNKNPNSQTHTNPVTVSLSQSHYLEKVK